MIDLELKAGRLVRVVCLSFAGWMVLAMSIQPASAQTGAGTVTGTVRDVNQAVVPGAGVTITETETNISHKTQTSNVGIYYFGALPLGPYKLVVEKEGFKTWEGTLVLEVGQNAVIDPVMQVGNVKTTIEVTAAAPVVSKQDVEFADVKDFRRIQQLPLDSRSVSQLFQLTPGVEGRGSARVNGMKVGSLAITLDGVSQVDRFGGGFVRVEPALNTIQEFRIETTGSDARYDRPATVTLSTKSGTNQFHGEVFETHRNNFGGLQVRTRDNTSGAAPSKFIRNEFGASAGGPIYIPHLYDGRNKAFFFASYEGSRQRESNVVQDTVPTDAMWNGDLSQEVDPCTGNPLTIYDPLTTDPVTGLRQPFPGNIIPKNRLSPLSQELASLTMRPNQNVNPNLGPNLFHAYPDNTSLNKLTIKEDQKISDKDNLSVRWTRDTRRHVVEGGVFGDPITPSAGFGTQLGEVRINDVAVNYNRTISNTLLNQLLVGVDRSNNHSGTLADNTDWADKLGFPNPLGATGWPTLCAGFVFSWDADNRHDQALTNATIEEIATWVKGKHNIQFGGKGRREYNNVRELQQAQGSNSFDGGWTSLFAACGLPGFTAGQSSVPFTGDGGFADMLLGSVSTLRNHYNRGYFYFRQTEGALFFNDKWKATPRLTLTLGLRWDKWTPYSEKQNRMVNVDFNTLSNLFQVVTPGNHDINSLPGIPSGVLKSWAARGLTFATAQSVGYPSNLFQAANHDFGPRLGAAFAINNKTVLNAGYGSYFWPMPLAQILQAARTNPPLDLRFSKHLNLQNDPDGTNNNNYTFVSRPAPTDFVGKAILDISGVFPIDQTAREGFFWDGRHWRDSHVQEWHVTLERELMPNTLMRLAYIGNHGSDLEQQIALNGREADINYVMRTGNPIPNRSCTDPKFTNLGCGADLLRVNPNWNFSALNHSGFSNTNSGQIEIERKFSKGVGLQWFYTYTRSLTSSDTGGFDCCGSGDINSGANGGRVPENINVRGEPNLTYDQRLRLVYFNSTNIPPHRIRFNGIVDLPFGQGKRFGSHASGALNQLIGGWQIATIGDWRGGFWQTPSLSRFQYGSPRIPGGVRPEADIFGTRQRLWFLGDFNPTLATNVTSGNLLSLIPVNPADRVVRQLGPDCSGNFIDRIALTLSNGNCYNARISGLYNWSPRGNIMGPGAWNTDLSFFKNFKIKERGEVRFTADFFNAFNHPQDPEPNSTTGLQNLSFQVNSPRTIQFSLRVNW